MTTFDTVEATTSGKKRTPVWQRVAIALAILVALVIGGACFVGAMAYMSQHAYDRHLDRGNAYWNAGEYEAALAEFAVQLEMYPDDWRAYVNRAGVYLHMGEYSRAIEEAGKAIELNPEARNAVHLSRRRTGRVPGRQ